jgi:hypothetical protein
MELIVVVFPAPFRPIKPIMVPGVRLKDTFSSLKAG